MLTIEETRELIELANLEILTSESVVKLLDFLGINYSVIDKNGNYIIQNGSMIQSISDNLTRAELIDQDSWKNCKKVMLSGKMEAVEECFKGAWFLSIKKPLIKNGKTLGIVVLSSNITDRKKNEVLLHDKELLEAKVKTTIILSRSISHEIRNALAGVSIHADILTNAVMETKNLITAKNEQLNTSLDKIIANALELKNAIKSGIYTVETLTANTQETKINKSCFAHYAMEKSIEEVLAEYPFVDQEKKQVTLNGEDFTYFGSKFHLKHVISNLIRNALHAFDLNPNKKGKIKITMMPDKQFNRVIVEDNGCGIAKNIRDNLFTPFMTTKDSGIGLGLAFCKLVMEAHDGDITYETLSAAENPKNSFTRFILKLPIE